MAPLWTADALWPLPPNPYVNHTPKADAKEKAKWLVVGLTLFLPRLLVVILTSACLKPGHAQRTALLRSCACERAQRSVERG